ncbi:protein of unknown function [Magnetospirillum sp. XM-1]|nr:protein of unknown function [Magnetospirillum sp. XM-1]
MPLTTAWTPNPDPPPLTKMTMSFLAKLGSALSQVLYFSMKSEAQVETDGSNVVDPPRRISSAAPAAPGAKRARHKERVDSVVFMFFLSLIKNLARFGQRRSRPVGFD